MPVLPSLVECFISLRLKNSRFSLCSSTHSRMFWYALPYVPVRTAIRSVRTPYVSVLTAIRSGTHSPDGFNEPPSLSLSLSETESLMPSPPAATPPPPAVTRALRGPALRGQGRPPLPPSQQKPAVQPPKVPLPTGAVNPTDHPHAGREDALPGNWKALLQNPRAERFSDLLKLYHSGPHSIWDSFDALILDETYSCKSFPMSNFVDLLSSTRRNGQDSLFP
jgi:hypothetical protein